MLGGCDSTNPRIKSKINHKSHTFILNYLFPFKARLGGAEGRVRAMDAQITQLEASKRELEQKLNSVISTLRRIAGVQLDGSVSMPYRLLSPSRRWSPARCM